MQKKLTCYHVGISGGKDSGALLLWMVHESGIPADQIIATFCDTGNVLCRNDNGFEGEHDQAWPDGTAYQDNPSGYREDYQGAPVRVRLKDKKGGDMSEWPLDLRIREMPQRFAS